MFEFLYHADPTQALSGVHFAIRRINFRGARAEGSHPTETADVASQTPEVELGLKIIEEIERVESAPLQRLSETKAEKYVKKLSEVVDKLTREKFDYKKNLGRELLKEWDADPIIETPPLYQPLTGDKVILLAAYLITMTLTLAYLLLKLWPTADPSGAWREGVSVFGLTATLDLEVRLILLALLAGGLGSCVHTLSSFVDYVGNRRLVASWVMWYAIRPFVGMAMAVVFYCLIRGTTLFGAPPQTATRFFWVVALSGLVGMLSTQLNDKLNEVFSTLFRPAPARGDERLRDSLSWPVPSVDSITPNEGPTAGGTAVILTGNGMARGAAVTFGGALATAVTHLDDRSLRAVTPAHEAGAVDVAVINPDGRQTVLIAGYTFY